MVDISASARRLYRRMVGRGDPRGAQSPGIAAEADGLAAVAVVEASASDAAGLGASYPAAAAARRFLHQAESSEPNLFHHRLAALEGARGRGGLAAALGLSSSGLRATAFLSGPDLNAALDLLGEAARRHLPLVVHLAARAGQGAGDTLGSGHEAYHAAASSGVVELFAANVQEAVDFTLIARRVAENGLATVLVAMDGAETALAVQDVYLPSPDLVRRFLGVADEEIDSPTPSQQLLFGHRRRRVPRWHDVERPLLSGAPQGPDVFALGEAARRAYFDSHLPELVDGACEAFGRETGRRHTALSTHRLEGAQLVLVAQGAAVETAEAVADAARSDGLAVGVVGVRLLRPLPAARLVELLRGRGTVLVLERLDAPVRSEAPLGSEIRSLLERAGENHRFGAETHPSLPAVQGRELPRLASVSYGFGGFPLRGGDLLAACHEYGGKSAAWRPRVYLGLEMAAPGPYPKRAALCDTLVQSYPEASRLGLRGGPEVPELRPKGALTVAVHRPAGVAVGFAAEAAMLLGRLAGGQLRSRPSLGWGRGTERVDLFTHAPSSLKDPGDELREEIAIWLRPGTSPGRESLKRLVDGGAVLLAEPPSALSHALRRAVEERGATLYAVSVAPEARPVSVAPEARPVSEARQERLLGAFAGVLAAEKKASVQLRKLLAARRETLGELGEAEREALLDALQAGFESVARLDPGAVAKEEAALPRRREAPALARRRGKSAEPLGDLPGFWDRVGVLYRDGVELVPDPFLATGTVPAMATALHEAAPRAVFPAFDPVPCTGCGDCWTVCPTGAIGPSVSSPAALLDFAMSRARRRGGSVDKLRMVSSKLAAAVTRKAAAEGFSGAPAGALFDDAFAETTAGMPEDRRTAVAAAYQEVREEIAELPVARTAPFFDDSPEKELFVVAVDPDVCKACGLCVTACEPRALTEAPDGARRNAAARVLWELREELPEPGRATLERAREHPEVGPLAGALLSRAARDVMSGDDGSEPGSGLLLALRQVFGTAAYHLETVRAGQLGEITKLRAGLREALHESLAKALPDGDLEALGAGLDAVEQPDVDLSGLVARVETAFETERIDVARARRLVETARTLDKLALRWSGDGSGDAGFSVVVAFDAAAAADSPEGWLGTFPDNPFAVPVTFDATGDAADLARGLIEGQLRESLETVRALRRARVEIEGSPKSARAAQEALASLAWADLDAEERRLVAPLLLVTADSALQGSGLAGLLALLETDLPVKLVVVSDAATGPARRASGATGLGGRASGATAAASNGAAPPFYDLRRLSAACPEVYMAQTTVAHGDHLEQGVAGALAADGPAVLRVLAPRGDRRRFARAATVLEAREAVASARYVLFRSGSAAPEEAVPEDPVAELERRHAAEILALRGEYEARLGKARAGFQQEMAQQVQGRLLQIVEAARGEEK